MLKRYFLALLILSCSINSYAGLFGDIMDVICNIDQNDITEKWNGQEKQFKSNALCPPWNKNGGRTGTCLQQFNFPDRFIAYYFKYCAQDTKENTFFEPKIAINLQACNALACFHMSSTLKWDGECLMRPGPYVLPLVRICARVANPPSGSNIPNSKPKEADPGYTLGTHLNLHGETVADENPKGYDGQEVIMNRPKLCAYGDPGLFNLISDTGIHTDALDWNPVSQPLHFTTKNHWLAELLKFLVTYHKMSVDTIQGFISAMGDNSIINVMKFVLGGISKILELFYTPAVYIIDTFGSLNSAVDDTKLGCVEIPLGPYPPPFCPQLSSFNSNPIVERICGNDETGAIIQSTLDNQCIVARNDGTVNNLINNSVRISIDNPIVLCDGNKKGSDETDKCVTINGLLPASEMHNTLKKDIIPLCNSEINNKPCVNTKIPAGCNDAKNECIKEFRIVYMRAVGDQPTSFPSNYFISGIKDCEGKTESCQKIWGVNSGPFEDVSLTFKAIDDGGTLEQNIIMKDNSKKFKVTIVREPTILKLSSEGDFTQKPSQICVFENIDIKNTAPAINLVGCIDREPLTKISLYPCGNSQTNDPLCTKYDILASYFEPQVVASIRSKDGKYSTKRLLKALTVQDQQNQDYKTNLAGFNISTFVADIPDNITVNRVFKPFDINNQRSITPLSIYGTYKGLSNSWDISPKQSDVMDGKIDLKSFVQKNKGYTVTDSKKIKYSWGLEYLNDHYIRGGNHICVNPEDIQHCPLNQKNCVLTKLKNYNVVDCARFFQEQAKKPGLRLCNSDDKKSGVQEQLEGLNIYQLSTADSQFKYCYETPNTQQQEEVCVVTTNPNDRVVPSPTKGSIDGYYDTKFDPTPKDQDTIPLKNATVDCNVFGSRKALLTDLKLCPRNWSQDTNCQSEKITGITGKTGVTIYTCNNINCYVNHDDANQEVCAILFSNATVDCNVFNDKQRSLGNLQLCPENQSQTPGCTSEDIPGIPAQPGQPATQGITINKCGNSNCYINKDNKTQAVCTIQSTIHTANYDPKTQVVRDKTPEELGLCVPIPLPECAEVKTLATEHGNALWPATKVGDISKGSCQSGWKLIDPTKPLERYCVPNAVSKSIIFEELDYNVGCKPGRIEFTCDNGNNKYWDLPKTQDDNGFTFGGSPDYNYFSVSHGLYSSFLKFNIDNKEALQYFRLSSVAYDDYVNIIVNDDVVYTRGVGNSITSSNFDFCWYFRLPWGVNGGCPDGGKYFTDKYLNLDLLPYLKEGNNSINVYLIVIGGGGLYYRIDYKFKE